MKPHEAESLCSLGYADYFEHGAEHSASLPALIGAAIHGATDSPMQLAESALEQLSNDLTMLAEAFQWRNRLGSGHLQRHIGCLAEHTLKALGVNGEKPDAATILEHSIQQACLSRRRGRLARMLRVRVDQVAIPATQPA